MLFRINPSTERLENLVSDWAPRELELERYLITSADSEVPVMSESVFGEPLLLVSNQVRTSAKKRADILALDRAGNGVIIELKRNAGRLGVETQALQYLADFSNYRGRNFLRKFSGNPGVSDATVLGFVGDKADIEDLNVRSRVILVARSFDETIYSLGEWLSSKGIAFRCIAYQPVQIGSEQLLSFSVAFDRSPDSLYALTFSSAAREPGIFWHNVALPRQSKQSWWDFLVSKNQIAACFDNAPGDQGEKILTKYMPGDRVVAYATGYGAIGWAEIDGPNKYSLIAPGDKDDVLCGDCRHRQSVKWRATAKQLEQGLPAEEIRREFNIYHPVSTSVSMNTENGKKLLARLSERFSAQRFNV
jgi:hypothetical protein